MSSPRDRVLITASELQRMMRDGAATSILDVRWELAKPDGLAAYEAGHVPGARYVSLEDELTDHAVEGRGRHPLPSGSALAAAGRRWGLRQGVPVVVYDDWNRAGSARAWWTLTAAGIPDVRILDGGLAAWKAVGGELETGTAPVELGGSEVFEVRHDDLYAGALPVLTADEAAALGPKLVDARAPERYRGEVEPVDPVAGHVPGAVNVPSTSLLAGDGTFLGAEDGAGDGTDVRERLGAAEGAYCGSGVTAAVVVAASAAIGVPVALFPGSWSQWCAEPGRPVELGE